MFKSIRQATSHFASPAGLFATVITVVLGAVGADAVMRAAPVAEREAGDRSRQVLQDGSDWLSEAFWARKRESRLNQQGGYFSPETNPFDQGRGERRRLSEPAAPRFDGGLYRTVCVRLCDGYYFPMSFATTRDRFGEDEMACKSSCTADVRLFYHSSDMPDADNLRDLDGRAYADLENAFLYRTRYLPSCQCRPDPWSEAARQRHAMYATEAWQREARRLAKSEEGRAGRIRVETAAVEDIETGGTGPSPDGRATRGLAGSRMSLGAARERRGRAAPPQVVRSRDQGWRQRVFNNITN